MTRTYSPLLKVAFASGILAAVKLATFVLTNSLVVLSSALDSFIDTVISLLNNRMQKVARAAPDREHPFGHGGFEVISSLVQALFLIFSALIIAFQASLRLFGKGSAPTEPSEALLGAAIMGFSAISGAILSTFLRRHEASFQKKGERSLSITADRGHYLGDFFVNAAGAAGLVAVWSLEKPWLDSLFGLIGALGLVWAALPILRKSLNDILHAEIEPDLQKKIVNAIMSADSRIKGVHRLRTRGLGPSRFVDFHLKLPSNLSLPEAHDIGDKVTYKLKSLIPGMDVMIHIDPDIEPDDELWDPRFKR